MTKLCRMIRLMHALSSRRSITIADVVAVCGVCERSAYRYLNELSEAGFPLYYNPSCGGYLLANPVSIRSDTLNGGELALVMLSLLVLKSRLSGQPKRCLESIMLKLRSNHDLAIIGLSRMFQDLNSRPIRDSECAEIAKQILSHFRSAEQNERVFKFAGNGRPSAPVSARILSPKSIVE